MHHSKRPSLLYTFTDQQSLYWVYFNLLSSATVWLTLLFSVLTAIVPDLVIKAAENLRDSEKIKKIKQKEKENAVRFNDTNINRINTNDSSKINDDSQAIQQKEQNLESENTKKKKSEPFVSEQQPVASANKFNKLGTAKVTPK